MMKWTWQAGSLALAIALLSALMPTPAVAAPVEQHPLTISVDGNIFAPGIAFPVFADVGRVVPGDSATERVWLRNNAVAPGLLRLDVVNARATDMDLARTTALVFRDETGEEIGAVTIEDAIDSGSCAMISNDLVVPAGETLGVDVVLLLDDDLGSRPADSGRDGAQESVGFQLRASLSDEDAGPIGADQCPTLGDVSVGDPAVDDPAVGNPAAAPNGDLPATGGQINVGVAVGAAALVVAGLITAVVARRRKDVE